MPDIISGKNYEKGDDKRGRMPKKRKEKENLKRKLSFEG
jgi:hypothetical protein